MNYDEKYADCLNSEDWELIKTEEKEIKSLFCKIKRFYSGKERNQGNHCVITFFFVNDIIIAIADEFCENVSILGEDF